MNLQHRITMAPLTRYRGNEQHEPRDLVATYYEQRATRPGTLLISEATFISPAAGGYDYVPGIWNEGQIQSWKKVIDAVHKHNSYFYFQLWNLGRVAEKDVIERDGYQYISASDVPTDDNSPKPTPLTKQQIKEHIEAYVHAAKNAIAAGADGVEIHDANGYLLDQFLHENTNKRTDEYGGSIENRARFSLEIVDALIYAIGADKVAIRLSPWGTFGAMDFGISPIPVFSYLVSELEKRAQQGKRLSYIHVVEPRVTGNMDVENPDIKHSNDFIRSIWHGVLMRAGRMHVREDIDEFAKNDHLALFAVGRYFISNPDLVDKLENSAALTPYDRSTFYTRDANGYVDYPFSTKL